jgi:outer membrane protein assembly factor BamE (lipoprotein component of BamABCDE complex)
LTYQYKGEETMKKLIALSISCAAALALLTGCATTHGSEGITDKNKLSQIKPGKTTKADVEALLGRPAQVDLAENGEQVWNYQRADVSATSYIPFVNLVSKNNSDMNNLSIRFSKNGVVKDMASGSSKF